MNDILKNASKEKERLIAEKKTQEQIKKRLEQEELERKINLAKLNAQSIIMLIDDQIKNTIEYGYLEIMDVQDCFNNKTGAKVPCNNHSSSEVCLKEINSDYWVYKYLFDNGYEPKLEGWHDGINSGVKIVLIW